MFDGLQARVLEKGQMGFATSEIKALMREAQIFYHQDEKPRAHLFLKEAEDKLAFTLKSVSDALAAKIVRLEEDIAAKKAAEYPTKEFELRLEKIKTYLKQEDFLKARESISSIEEGLSTLTKAISADWQLKVSDLRRDVNYKRSIGYTLDEIPGMVGEIVEYLENGDLENLEKTYAEVTETLATLKSPAGFEADWNDFQKKMNAKIAQGYKLTELNDLSLQIKTAIEAKDFKAARLFLEQAKKTLAGLKDQQPPAVQVISFSETEDLIAVEGYASDNVKIKDVAVNNSIVKLASDGKFVFRTIPHPLVKSISIVAVDLEGNVSAPVNLPIGVQGEDVNAQAEVKDASIEYSEDALIVKGKYVPGGKIKVGTLEAVCDDQGQFAVSIRPEQIKAGETISVAGMVSEDSATAETVLKIEDRWGPRMAITKESYDNSFVPSLNLDPLSYSENKATVSGQVVLAQMANIEGRVWDLGGEMASLEAENVDIDIREDGSFVASLTFDRSRKDPMVKIIAKDKSGNASETQVALDAVWSWPQLLVNDVRTFQKTLGKFSKEVTLTADMTDIAIVLDDDKGQAIVSQRLPVAAVLPPELEIQDVRYEGAKVLISGRTTADGTVSEKGKTLFAEDIAVTKDAIFTLTADYPAVDQEIILVAANIEGRLSEEVKVIVGPPKDTKAPVIYLSSPQKDKKGAIISGSVEDSSGLESLTVQGVDVNVDER
ncbi:MAG TPA: hypothetical protein PKV41_06090, partial [Candidatus Omnitrophota bacterium]|nr:hypothetical protein [Candidatus Omnitrophota bacterium]